MLIGHNIIKKRRKKKLFIFTLGINLELGQAQEIIGPLKIK